MKHQITNNLKPDINMAFRHLSYIDQFEQEFTFFTHDDNKDRKSKNLIRVFNGTLDEHFDALTEQNNRGAAIHVTVNETDLTGRKTANMRAVRAIWQENDGDGLALPIEPHLIIESSPNKYHSYYFTSTDKLDEFASVQMRMVKDYGSDPNAKDLTRVLRLAGFYHQKVDSKKGLNGTPHLVSIKHVSDNPHLDWEELKKVFPPVEEAKNSSSIVLPKKQVIECTDEFGILDLPNNDPETLADLENALMFLAKMEVI